MGTRREYKRIREKEDITKDGGISKGGNAEGREGGLQEGVKKGEGKRKRILDGEREGRRKKNANC